VAGVPRPWLPWCPCGIRRVGLQEHMYGVRRLRVCGSNSGEQMDLGVLEPAAQAAKASARSKSEHWQ